MSNIAQSNKLKLFLLIIFLIITNAYYGELDINTSASSSYYYLNIANSYPDGMNLLNGSQNYIHGERFLISYIVGFISNLLSTNSFYIFQFLTYFGISILIIINYKIL